MSAEIWWLQLTDYESEQAAVSGVHRPTQQDRKSPVAYQGWNEDGAVVCVLAAICEHDKWMAALGIISSCYP